MKDKHPTDNRYYLYENIDPYYLDRENYKRMGVYPLTGEADGTNLRRMLCDVNEDGVRLVEEYFGNTVMIQQDSNWNSSVAEKDDAIGSIMLTGAMLDELWVYSFIRLGYYVYKFDIVGGLGIFADSVDQRWAVHHTYDEQFWADAPADWKDPEYRKNFICLQANGTAGTRNRHEMSGRVE